MMTLKSAVSGLVSATHHTAGLCPSHSQLSYIGVSSRHTSVQCFLLPSGTYPVIECVVITHFVEC